MTGWDSLQAELDLWRARNRQATIWWRDDDAVRPGPALDRLLDLASRHDAPLALAVIPAAAETALARPRAVIVPVAAEGEAEQTMRARLLEAAGVAVMLEEQALTPQALSAAMDRALAAERGPRDFDVDLGGAAASAAWIARALAERRREGGRRP